MVLEHAPFGRRGFFASFTLQGVQAGQILAAAVFLPIATYMSKAEFMVWGWRIPFLLSVVVIVVGYLIRREVEETPAFAKESEDGALPKLLHELNGVLDESRRITLGLPGQALRSAQQHQAIVNAIMSGEAGPARRAAGRHVAAVRMWVQRLMDTDESREGGTAKETAAKETAAKADASGQ